MYFVKSRDIAARLRRLRRANRMTQVQLAETLNVSVQAISRMENGHREITLPEAVEIARALHVSLDYLACVTNGYHKVGT